MTTNTETTTTNEAANAAEQGAPNAPAATGWQAHTCRGFISLLGSKQGMKIESSRRESDKARVYVAVK